MHKTNPRALSPFFTVSLLSFRTLAVTIFVLICLCFNSVRASDEYQFKMGQIFQSSGNKVLSFEIIGHAGKGAEGEVYIVQESTTNQQMALKLFFIEGSQHHRLQSDYIMPIRLETVLSPGRETPSVVEIMPVARKLSYIVDLAQQRGFEAQVELAFQVLQDIQKGIRDLNKMDLVHGDIKPANIMYLNGRFVITDLSATMRLKSGGPITWGTRLHMSSEQLSQREVTIYSDYYSLAVTLLSVFKMDPLDFAKEFLDGEFVSREKVLQKLRTWSASYSKELDREKFNEVSSFILNGLRIDTTLRTESLQNHFLKYPVNRGKISSQKSCQSLFHF